MRYEDASGTDSFAASQADAPATLGANNDVDVILAGHYGPATGNAISGAGTVSGSAGADLVAAGQASITAIQGAGGTDTSYSGGKLQIEGQYGVLTISAQGAYSYVRNQGTPDGVSDVFTYTLTGRDGSSDIANLTINIGKTATVVKANAVQVVPGPDGVVTLPPGVELSDIHVVGSDLVVDLPDGTQMVIVDGAVFVPQIVLGTIEIPASNLAALLIDSEPTPAAGPPQSSGGNFAVPVAPLDPGAPLGDLIPPTELDYTPPEFNDVINAIEDDELPLITDLVPSVSGGDVTVDEDDLPAGSDATKESLTAGGTFTISAPDGVESLTVGSLDVIVNGVFQGGVLVTPLGNTLTITGYNAATGVVSYTYTLGAAETHASGAGENSLFEDFLVTLTDEDGDVDTDTLSVNIIDDVPTANDDAAGLTEGGPSSVTVDVDTNDVVGADVPGTRTFTSMTGTYGNLTLNPDGTQTYALNAAGQLAIDALPPGSTLTDSFPYTLTDSDGDSDPATLVVTLTGTNNPPLIFNLMPSADGGEAVVDEDDLSDGSSPNAAALTVSSSFNISAPDGIDDLTVGGIQVIINGVFQAGATGLSPLGNQVTFTGFNPATGEISVSYTLLDNEAHASGLGENNLLGRLFDDMTVTLTDTDGEIATDTLSVQIIDDVPTANDDAFAILEGDPDNAITFDVDLNDIPGADGTASRNFTSLTGIYGNLTLNGDGTQTYALNAAGVVALNALPDGATLNDNFTYTLTDGDSDSDPATLVITLTGADDPPVITNLTPSAQGGDAVVDEDDLPDGSDTSKESLTTTGDFTISAPDGVNDLTVGGINVIIDGVFQVGASGATPLGNTITFTGYDIATGVISYSYTLLDNEAHANANGENSLFDDLTVNLTDTDNDLATATLSIRIVDDVPTAVNDTVNQGGENAPVTFSVFGNDTFGADGVDTDNSPTVAVTFTQPPIGQGTVSYNAATGLFTFTPAAGQQGSTSFTYTIIDGDGDPSTATVTINLAADSVPIVTNGVAAVDDDGLTGGNPASVIGDLDANAGEAAPANPSEAIFHGQLVASGGGDTIANYSFASMHGTSGTVGTETVNYTWDAGSNTLTATGPRGVLFNVVVDPTTGEYNLTLLDNVLHVSGGAQSGVGNNENGDATTNLTFTVTDIDGDSANGTIAVTFDDDAPTLGTIQDGTANNNPAAAVSVGTLNLTIGADSPASVNGISVDTTGITSGGKALVTNFSGGVLTAYQDANGNGIYNPATDTTAVFTLSVDPSAGGSGQYTFNLIMPLEPETVDVDLDFEVFISDADRDPVSGEFTINVADGNSPSTPEAPFAPLIFSQEAAGDSSAMSLKAFDGQEQQQQQQQQQKTAANINTVVLAAAVAAAGMAATSAAANDEMGDDQDSAVTVEAASTQPFDALGSSGSDETAISALEGETSEAASDGSSEASSGANGSGDDAAGGRSLTPANDVSPAAQPVDLLEATEMSASQGAESIIAPMVSMPSAEALIAAKLERGDSEGSQDDAIVGKVLADALEGGEAEASIDALLEALPAQGLGGNAAVEALANQPDAAVPGGDMGHLGGLSANANFTVEAMTLHHDAVQPVANG